MSAVLSSQIFDTLTERLMYQDSHVCIWHDWNGELLTLKWTGQQDLASVKRGGEQLLVLMRELDVHVVLNDDSDTVGTWMSAIPWIVFNLIPRVRKFGLRKGAHVYARNKLARLSADAAKLLIDLDEANIQLFGNAEAAKAWLREPGAPARKPVFQIVRSCEDRMQPAAD